jgi:hypothetical protein
VLIAFIVFAVLQAATVAAFLMAASKREAFHARERALLLQRIQAPGRAVTAHEVGPDPELAPAVDLFDDKDYWSAVEDRRGIAHGDS